MVVSCEIFFDNNADGIYYAGQTVAGRVELTADKPKQVQGLAIEVKGLAYTHFQGNKEGCLRRSVICDDDEEYITSTTYLLGSNENKSLTIDTGVYGYTFSCHIPTHSPPSFEGNKGHIRYVVRVLLLRPWKYDQFYTRGFTVLKTLDLNMGSPLWKLPTQSHVEKVFCLCPRQTEPLKIKVSMPQSGYVCGQRIPMKVLVTDDDRVPVRDIDVRLVMFIRYSASDEQSSKANTIIERQVLVTARLDSLSLSTQLFKPELLIPATPPTCMNLCSLIEITYEIEVSAKMPYMNSDILISVPVTIGTVPLVPARVIDQQPPRNVLQNGDMKTDQPTTPAADMATMANTFVNPLNTYKQIPRPHYEASEHAAPVHFKNDEVHDYGEIYFTPKYPVFEVPEYITLPTDYVDAFD